MIVELLIYMLLLFVAIAAIGVLLVIASTESGKTVLLFLIILTIVYIIDPLQLSGRI